jgi:hypothetical protein
MIRAYREVRNAQVRNPICARICARDGAGRVEIGETSKSDVDPHRASAEVSVITGDHARRRRRTSYGS